MNTRDLYRCGAGHFFVRGLDQMPTIQYLFRCEYRISCPQCFLPGGAKALAALVGDPVALAAYALGGIEAVEALGESSLIK